MAGECGSTCPTEAGFYAYSPSITGNAILLAAYATLTPAVFYLGIRFRTPVFSTILATGLILDIVGFLGRILLNDAPSYQAFFALSLLGTALGPAFISGAIFSTLPHILSVYGERMSPVQPWLVGFAFYVLVSLAGIIQLIGTILTSYELSGMSRSDTTRLVAGGLCVQLLALLAFTGLVFWFTISMSTRRSGLCRKNSGVYRSDRFKRFLFGTETACVVLMVYTVYRIIEMANGVNGNTFQSQVAYMVVIGIFPLMAALLITIFHPGVAFGQAWAPTSPMSVRKRRKVPPPLRSPHEQMVEHAHERYDPDIRSQKSPASQGRPSPPSKHQFSPTSQQQFSPISKHQSSPIPPSQQQFSPIPHQQQQQFAPSSQYQQQFSPISQHSQQFSPTSQKAQQSPTSQKSLSPASQRNTLRHSGPPELPSGSPGLPSNPKPAHTSTSPLPSPTGTTRTTGSSKKRFSMRRESRPPVAPKEMVDKDNIW